MKTGGKKTLLTTFIIIIMVFLQGCSIKREIKPVEQLDDKEICIVENFNVKKSFLNSYEKALKKVGLNVRILPEDSNLNSCYVTSTYTARWSWDLAIYLSYVQLDVYKDSKLSGSAHYDSRHGSGNMSKFIKGDELVNDLVDELFKKSK